MPWSKASQSLLIQSIKDIPTNTSRVRITDIDLCVTTLRLSRLLDGFAMLIMVKAAVVQC